MISVSQYEKVKQAETDARRAGFDLEVKHGAFQLKPVKGMAAVLSPTIGKTFHDLDDVFLFIDGWRSLETLLAKKAGFTVAEIRDRIEQQRVMNALKGKRSASRKTGS